MMISTRMFRVSPLRGGRVGAPAGAARAGGALLLALTLVTSVAGCGSGRGGADTAPATSAPETTTAETFGTLPSPCGPGSPSGAPDQGVDATTVKIGYGDDRGFPNSPGQGHESSDAIEALIKWCNDQGGINGRMVVGDWRDAKVTDATNVMIDACQADFMLVGQWWSLASAAEETRLGCSLPSVPGPSAGADAANSPLMVSPLPQPTPYFNVSGAAQIAEAFPAEVKKTAIMEANFPTVIDTVQRFTGTATTVGFEFLDCTQQYPISGVADYRPYLQRLKDCGAETVYTLDTTVNFINMLDAAALLDFHPVWINAITIYTPTMANGNTTGNADRVFIDNAFVPVDYTPEGSANAKYVDLVTANGGDVGYGGQVSTSAFLLWATAARACGNELTRDCVMDQLHDIHDWDAGGLSSPQDPGANRMGTCAQVLTIDGTTWTQWSPSDEGGFDCDPSFAVEVTPPPDSVAGLGLDANGVSTKFTVG